VNRRPFRESALAELLLLGCWIGLLTGLVQLLVVGVRRYLLGRLAWHGPTAVWMAPAAHALTFAALALALGLTLFWLRRDLLRTAAVGAFVFLGVMSQLVPYGEVARWAAALIAVGLAVQAVRLFRRDPPRWLRRAARSSAVIASLALVLGLAQSARTAIGRRAALRDLPAAPAGAPNVLLVILDTVRPRNLGLYGYARGTTPALDRLAAQGVVFDRAIATSSWSLPSHGSLLTGELGSRLGGGWLHPIRFSGPRLPEAFRARGYATGGFVANLLYTSYESGLSEGFLDYHDYRVSLPAVFLHNSLLQTGVFRSLKDSRSIRQVWRALREFDLTPARQPASDAVSAATIADEFLEWERGLNGRPFFAMLNLFDAHIPYRSPRSFQERFATSRRKEDRYDASIAYIDSELDRLVTELERRGTLDRSIVVITSDHGELFGEHGLEGHAKGLYLGLLHVPLIVRYPAGVPAGRRVDATASLQDLPATIADLAGLGPVMPGTSLARRWRGEGGSSLAIAELDRGINVDPAFPNARTWVQSVVGEEHHYLRDGLGREELYAYRSDSLERTDLAQRPESAEVLRRFRAVLDSATGRLTPAGRPRSDAEQPSDIVGKRE
jgi:arylsulfatase A-like enzyme